MGVVSKADSVPSMNLGKEGKYELHGGYEQTFNTSVVFCLSYLHMNTSMHIVKFRHRDFSCLIFLSLHRKSTQTQERDFQEYVELHTCLITRKEMKFWDCFVGPLSKN